MNGKVLCADDMPAMRALITATLENDASIQVREAADGMDTALAGPLGLVGGESKQKLDIKPQKEKRVGQSPTPHVPDMGFDSENVLPEKFILQIDGVGSFMVARNARVSIGPISLR